MNKRLPLLISIAVIAIIGSSFLSAKSKKQSFSKKLEQSSVVGLWIGTYAVDGQPKLGEQYYSFILKPDGTMIVDSKFGNQQYLSTGTWTLNKTNLNCTFTCVSGASASIGISQSCSAVWDSANSLIGSWRNFPPLKGSGNVLLNRAK